jgi:hypothetical protein
VCIERTPLRLNGPDSQLLCTRCPYTEPYYAPLNAGIPYDADGEGGGGGIPGAGGGGNAHSTQPGGLSAAGMYAAALTVESVKSFVLKLVQFSEDRPRISAALWHAVHAELRRNALFAPHQIRPTPIEHLLKAFQAPADVQHCALFMANTYAGHESALFGRDERTLLTRQFIEFSAAFAKLHKKGKTPFPKTPYLLHQLCLKNGWPQRARTFALPGKRTALEESDRVFRRVCRSLRWNCPRTI